MHNRFTRIAMIAALAVTVAACAGADPAPPTTVAPPTTEAPADDVIEVTMVDFAYVGLPESVPAGTRFTVVNASEGELHELVAFRLADGDQRTAAELASLSPVELEEALGMPTTVLLAAPGGPQIAAVGDGVLAEAGRYVLFCFIPTGIDPDEYLAAAATSEGPPQFEDAGPPHFVHGMLADLTVSG